MQDWPQGRSLHSAHLAARHTPKARPCRHGPPRREPHCLDGRTDARCEKGQGERAILPCQGRDAGPIRGGLVSRGRRASKGHQVGLSWGRPVGTDRPARCYKAQVSYQYSSTAWITLG